MDSDFDNTENPNNRTELLVIGWIRLFIETKCNNIPQEIKLICKAFFGAIIDTKILTTEEKMILLKYLYDQTSNNWNWKLIYRGSEYGFTYDDFHTHCDGISNSVVIIHNEKDQVYGGYTPCKWGKIDNDADIYQYVLDPSLTTFLFILRNDVGDGAKIATLKTHLKDRAICYADNTGFDFGRDDLFLYNQRVYFFQGMGSFELKGDHEIHSPSKPQNIEVFHLFE